jgi:hypothetical protein
MPRNIRVANAPAIRPATCSADPVRSTGQAPEHDRPDDSGNDRDQYDGGDERQRVALRRELEEWQHDAEHDQRSDDQGEHELELAEPCSGRVVDHAAPGILRCGTSPKTR